SRERIQKNAKSPFVVIDGIRSMNEFLEFAKLGSAILIAVHAAPRSRYEFLRSRQRSDSPTSSEEFEARDRRELSVGIGESIAMADEIIINSGSIAELQGHARELFKRLKLSGKSSA